MRNDGVISIDKNEAKGKLKELRANMHAEADENWKMLEKYYVHAGQGRKVIDINKAFQAAPVDEKGRPRLAIARAHGVECRLHWRSADSDIQFYATVTDSNSFRGYREFNDTLKIDIGRRMPAQRNAQGQPIQDPWRIEGWAMLPMIPPEIRSKFHTLNGYHLLWEVPRWADKSNMAVPVDPFILKKITGNLYAIYAEWEITETERQVLEAARVI